MEERNGSLDVCHTKKRYYTPEDALEGAQKALKIYGGKLQVVYSCDAHWHLTHADKSKARGTGKYYWRCPHCKNIIKHHRIEKHQRRCTRDKPLLPSMKP